MVEVVAGVASASIVATGEERSLRYVLADTASELELKSPEGRVLIESSPYPRVLLESADQRFELGRDPKTPNTLARWAHDGGVDTWPPAPSAPPGRE